MNEQIESISREKPDFVKIKTCFETALTNGQRAEIRRVRSPDELDWIPAFYRLIPRGEHIDNKLRRLIFLLPFASHKEGTESIGNKLAGSKISEMRLFQMGRSDYPNDILHLRRILQQVQSTLDWKYFGEIPYYWGENVKRKIIEEYYISFNKEENESGENNE